jgi:hypothetical protein
MIAFVLAVTVAASPAAQQAPQGPPTIDPGMSRSQVVAKLGEPMSSRSYDGHTYLLYKNGCERSCGMSDLVVLDSDKVVDAIFRSNGRRYSGTSSSPRMLSMADLHHGPEKAERVASAPASEKPAKPVKVAKAAKVAKVAAPKVEVVEKTEPASKAAAQANVDKAQKPTKVEKVEGGDTAPIKPAAEKPAPKLPEVFRPAPTPKKDTAKKADSAKKAETIKKPAS